MRLVAHLDNPAVARAVEEVTCAAAVLDVAARFSRERAGTAADG